MREINKAQLVAAMLGVAGGMPQVRSTEKHAPINGRIVGWDNGKAEKKQPRNAPCKCGSGMKAKRCCGGE